MEKRFQEITNLMNDIRTNRVEMYADSNQAKNADEAVREIFYDILGDDKLTWRGWRNHKNEIFTILEDTLNDDLPALWDESPFYRSIVEVRNLALGDKNEFVAKNYSWLVASTFAGNHWDTDRTKLPSKKVYSIPTNWAYIHLYDDFERFMKGLTSLSEFYIAMRRAFSNKIDSDIATAFNAAAASLPAGFYVTGSYDFTKMTELIQKVEMASQSNVILAGSRVALANMVNGMNASWASNPQKEELATTGKLLTNTGLGVNAVEIPQTFQRGTYSFAISDKIIYVLPDEKCIKLVYEGDTRARELTEQDTHDQTIDAQVQTKYGVGVLFNGLFGTYTLP